MIQGGRGAEAERPRIRRQVVMITGSHHQNIYWYATGHDRGLNVLPGVYLIEERQWATRSAVVMHPPGQSLAMLNGHWNAICIVCHTTLGKTAFDTPYQSEPFEMQAIDTSVAEFGIACESCHGPAQAHVEANRSPLRRYGLHVSDTGDPTVVQPTLLDPQRSSQVCGQCHSVWEFYDVEANARRTGQDFPIDQATSSARRGSWPSRRWTRTRTRCGHSSRATRSSCGARSGPTAWFGYLGANTTA